jgi:hypothetical protein
MKVFEGGSIMARSATRGVCMAILLAAFLAAPHCFGVTREFTKTFPLQADGSFELKSFVRNRSSHFSE